MALDLDFLSHSPCFTLCLWLFAYLRFTYFFNESSSCVTRTWTTSWFLCVRRVLRPSRCVTLTVIVCVSQCTAWSLVSLSLYLQRYQIPLLFSLSTGFLTSDSPAVSTLSRFSLSDSPADALCMASSPLLGSLDHTSSSECSRKLQKCIEFIQTPWPQVVLRRFGFTHIGLKLLLCVESRLF